MTLTNPFPRPVPDATLDSQPFWDGVKNRQLTIQLCDRCAVHNFRPRPLCPNCGSTDLSWVNASGKGTVWSYSVVHRPVSAAFREAVPYVVALIELEEGPLLMSNIVGIDAADVTVGLSVELTFSEEHDGRVVPLFKPVR